MNELIEKDKIENMIYEIRGKQVMLDSDLAKLYEVETKRINEAVYRNQEKFPERFSFVLNNEESIFLVANCDQKNERRGGRYKNPRVFTEQGVAMLATILKSKIATRVSIKIMDAFVAMRKYIGNSEYRLSNVESKIIEHDNSIKLLQESFNKFEEKRKVNEIYFNGQIYDAYSKIIDILKEAKKEIVLIDGYADKTVLDIISKLDVKVTIICKENCLLSKMDIKKYNEQYSNLKVKYDSTFHDRYFMLDGSILYHCGTSLNRIGYKTFSINKIEDRDVLDLFLTKIKEIYK